MNLAADIAEYLDGKAIGTFSPDANGGNIFIERLPTAPDTCIAIRHTGGAISTGLPLIEPTIQLVVRGDTDPRTALELADEAMAALKYKQGAITLAGEDVSIIWPLNDIPAYVGIDENGRHMYSINLRISINVRDD